MRRNRFSAIVILLCTCLLGIYASAQAPPVGPNSDPTYQQLRNIGLGSEAISVSNVSLRRDAANFQFRSGTICFLAPVQGKVTGAVFIGDGKLIIDPPLDSETSMLKLLTRENEFSENFSRVVLRFTDTAYQDLKELGSAASGTCDPGVLQDAQSDLRHKLRYNLSARLLQDVLSPEPGGLFVAFIHGKRYSDKELFAIDPHGVPEFAEAVYGGEPDAASLAPEEVALMTYEENKYGYWGSFHLSPEYKDGTATGAQRNSVMHIDHQQIETAIEKSGTLAGKATVSLVSLVDGLRVVPFNLYRTLRVQSATGADGQPLSFIREDKDEDYQLFVVLPKALGTGEKFTLTLLYGGKQVVSNEGAGNYHPRARENWYPNAPSGGLGDYTSYDLTFRIPKGMKMVATGTLVSETEEGGQNVSVWKSDVPLTVAGFSFGRFKAEHGKAAKENITVDSYANQESPDWVRGFKTAAEGDVLPVAPGGSHASYVAVGSMSTVGLNKKALAEGEIALNIYSDYFGPIPYSHVALTQQTACGYGQAWPGLVWIPICYFFDTTVRHTLGVDWGDRGYWRSVTAHEVAHQWWGHTVGFNSYRDQWMSEGFAEASASIYLQMVYAKDPKQFVDFWKDQRELLTERNKEGFRAIDAGPVTVGYRLSNTRSGFDITRRLIYPKGGYILHMIRMMMWGRQTGDERFKETMRDFVKTYTNSAATTEDFKAIVEKHMTPEMDLDGNHRMDWFFNEYVYGTALPTYKIESSFQPMTDGTSLHFKLSQSGVDAKFRMLVPIYLETADGRVVFLGRVGLLGNTAMEQAVPLKGVKEQPKRAIVNYRYDVLAASN